MQKQAVLTAVQREVDIGNFLVERYKEKLDYFEKKYKLSTGDFIGKFESGKLGDTEELFEWFAVAQAEKHWQGKLMELKT